MEQHCIKHTELPGASRLFADLSEQGVLTVKGRQLLLHRREALLPAE